MQTGHLLLIATVAVASCCLGRCSAQHFEPDHDEAPQLHPAETVEVEDIDFPEVQDKWRRLSENADLNQESPPASSRYLPPSKDDGQGLLSRAGTLASPVEVGPQVSESLLAWISNQCENMIEEIEAIAKQNSVAKSFSPVNYLRYLFLYERLLTISKQPHEELKWVKRKVKIFGSVYKQSVELLRAYLEHEHIRLVQVEEAEPKGKQVSVSDAWMEHYLNIRYLAVHAPKHSELAERAVELLTFSPENNPLRQRSARFEVKTRAFSR